MRGKRGEDIAVRESNWGGREVREGGGPRSEAAFVLKSFLKDYFLAWLCFISKVLLLGRFSRDRHP